MAEDLFLELNSDKKNYILTRNQNEIINSFIEFIYSFKDKRTIGVATIIDVFVYVVSGIIFLERGKEKGDKRNVLDEAWKLLDEALISYLVPQLDRFDVDVLSSILENSKIYFQDLNQGDKKLTNNFIDKIEKMYGNLEKLNELFNSKNNFFVKFNDY